MGIIELLWTAPLLVLIVLFFIAIAPLFIWIHVRAIRYKFEGYLKTIAKKEGTVHRDDEL